LCEKPVYEALRHDLDTFLLAESTAASYPAFPPSAAMSAIAEIAIMSKPPIEAHLSSIHTRKGFRRAFHVSPAAMEEIAGFGKNSCLLSMDTATTFSLSAQKRLRAEMPPKKHSFFS
jgi:hypothetical protein